MLYAIQNHPKNLHSMRYGSRLIKSHYSSMVERFDLEVISRSDAVESYSGYSTVCMINLARMTAHASRILFNVELSNLDCIVNPNYDNWAKKLTTSELPKHDGTPWTAKDVDVLFNGSIYDASYLVDGSYWNKYRHVCNGQMIDFIYSNAVPLSAVYKTAMEACEQFIEYVLVEMDQPLDPFFDKNMSLDDVRGRCRSYRIYHVYDNVITSHKRAIARYKNVSSNDVVMLVEGDNGHLTQVKDYCQGHIISKSSSKDFEIVERLYSQYRESLR